MSTHTIKGFITYRAPYYADDKPEIAFFHFDPSSFNKDDPNPRVVICEHSFEIEIPDDFDPRPGQIELLKAAKEAARAEFAAKVVAYDRRINELLAIENSPTTETVGAET